MRRISHSFFLILLGAVLLAGHIACAQAAPGAGPADASQIPHTIGGFAMNIPDGDLSMQLTESIFGPVWGSMLDNGGVNTHATGSGNLLGRVALVLNVAALALTGFLVAGTWVTATLSTGHTGVTLGEKYSTLWVPLRIAIAILCLMPVAGGYSLLMASVMFVGKGGAGVGDALTTYSNDYIALQSGIVVPPSINGVGRLAQEMLASDVCMISMNKARPHSVEFKTTGNASGSDTWALHMTGANSASGADVCGVYTVTHVPGAPGMPALRRSQYERANSALSHMAQANTPDRATVGTPVSKPAADSMQGIMHNAAVKMHQAHIKALFALSKSLMPVAHQLADGGPPSDDAYHKAVAAYHDELVQDAQSVLQIRDKSLRNSTSSSGKVAAQGVMIKNALEQMHQCGWICEGSFYWVAVSVYKRINQLLSLLPTGQGPVNSRIAAQNPDLLDVGDALDRTHEFVRRESILSIYDNQQKAPDLQTMTGRTTGAEGSNAISKFFARAFFHANEDISQYISNGGTPILNGSQIGHVIVGSAESLYAGYIAMSGGASGIADGWLGDVPILSSILHSVKSAFQALSPLIFTVFLTLLALGMLLAYWLPAIPMVLWIFAGINWLILLVQAVWACVVWAPAHAIPDGEGAAGSHARPGYMLLLALFMTPALMLAGLFSAMLIMGAAGRLIGVLFPIILESGNITSLLGVIGFIASMALLTVLYVTSADHAFALIHVIRDKILRWISGPQESLGESESANRTRIMMAGVMGRFEAMTQNSMSPDTGRRPKPDREDEGKPGKADQEDYHNQ